MARTKTTARLSRTPAENGFYTTPLHYRNIFHGIIKEIEMKMGVTANGKYVYTNDFCLESANQRFEQRADVNGDLRQYKDTFMKYMKELINERPMLNASTDSDMSSEESDASYEDSGLASLKRKKDSTYHSVRNVRPFLTQNEELPGLLIELKEKLRQRFNAVEFRPLYFYSDEDCIKIAELHFDKLASEDRAVSGYKDLFLQQIHQLVEARP
jgi:hypothetical protein